MLRWMLVAAGLVVLGFGGFLVFAWRPAIAPIPVPLPSSFSPELVQNGAALASAGYCSTCHTAAPGEPYAGGYAIVTQFGTMYSTNITPDPNTGIGHWSEAAFARAMRKGVARNGGHLLPAFPYNHFTELSDQDISALYAYLMTRKPILAPARQDSFPLNIRFLQAGWKLLFFRPGRFKPEPAHTAAWNRGAYLAGGISHCGACHTPRNLLGAEEQDHQFTGAVIDNWIAPSLTNSNPSPVPWTKDELTAYLSTGVSHFHGTAAGPMAPVVRGLARLPQSDIAAIATYFSDLDGAAKRPGAVAPAIAKALATDRIGTTQTYNQAARLYTAACASCHYNGANEINPLRPDLALNSAVDLDDPTNLIQVILHGISANDGAPGVVMPAFSGFSNADVTEIASYLRATRTNKAPWPNLEKKIAAIRAAGAGGE